MVPARLALLVTLAVVLAGCGGTLVAYEATPATVPEDAAAAEGYVHGNTTAVPITYPVGVAGVSRNVTAETWVSGYHRTTATNDTAVFLLYSSPAVDVGGRTVNPLGQLGNREVANFLVARAAALRGFAGVGEVTELREVAAREVTMFGTPTTFTSYAGTAEAEGERTGIVVHVASVDHGGDVVVAIGLHGDEMDEADRQATLLERAVHEG